MAESERSELEEKFAHLPAKSQPAEGSVFESVPAESVAHDGANRRPSLDGAACTDGGVLGRSASVKGFAQTAQQSGSITVAMEKRKTVVDAESDYWEKAPGTKEVVHSAPDLEEFFIGEVEDGPGQYKALSQLAVSETCDEFSALIGEVGEGSVMQVMELVADKEVQRLRARLASPAGWISLADLASGEHWAQKVVEKPGPSTDLPIVAGVCEPASSSQGSGGDSPVKLAALSILGSSLAAAASRSSPAAEPPATTAREEPHDPFEEFDRAQKVADSWGIPPASAQRPESEASLRRQESMKKLGNFARSTSRSFLDWTAKAVDKIDGAPEKLQDWKQRTTASFDRAGERLDELVTRVDSKLVEAGERLDSKLDSNAQNWTEKHIPHVRETSERVAGGVASVLADTSRRVSQDVREAMEGTGSECQATMSLVNLHGEPTGDEMIDAYFARG